MGWLDVYRGAGVQKRGEMGFGAGSGIAATDAAHGFKWGRGKSVIDLHSMKNPRELWRVIRRGSAKIEKTASVMPVWCASGN